MNEHKNEFLDRLHSIQDSYKKIMEDSDKFMQGLLSMQSRGFSKEGMLEKAFEWLRKESKYYVLFDSVGYRGFNEEGLVKGFQKAMKGE